MRMRSIQSYFVDVERVFTTSWDAKLKLSTVAILLLVLVLTVVLALPLTVGPAIPPAERIVLRGVMVIYALVITGAVVSGIVYSPRAYRLTNEELVIERGVSPHRLRLDSILSVERLDDARMRRTWRTGGIGGLFCWHGWFSNRQLGEFYMSATRSDRRVLLRTAKQRIVLTPDSPDEFVATLAERIRGSAAA